MSKELPYFRFTVSEWLNDDISCENYKIKGVFIDVCSFYWFRDCSCTVAMLQKRFSDAKKEINYLIEYNIIKVIEGEVINITFLDKQYDQLSEKRRKRQEAGKIGGLQKASNATAKLKQKPSYKDNNKDKDNIPALVDFISYCKTLKIYHFSMDFQIEAKYNSWVESGWKDGNNKNIKNWKTKISNTMPYFPKDKSSTNHDISKLF